MYDLYLRRCWRLARGIGAFRELLAPRAHKITSGNVMATCIIIFIIIMAIIRRMSNHLTENDMASSVAGHLRVYSQLEG